MGKELVIGNAAGLREAVHATADFDINVPIVDEAAEIVEVEDVGRDCSDGNAHVFVAVFQGRVQVEIFKINAHELGTGGGDDTVEEDLGCSEICGFGADFTGVIDLVAASGPTDTGRIGFLGAVSDDVTEVGSTASGRDIGVFDKENSVSTFYTRVALGEASDLIRAGILPDLPGTAAQ